MNTLINWRPKRLAFELRSSAKARVITLRALILSTAVIALPPVDLVGLLIFLLLALIIGHHILVLFPSLYRRLHLDIKVEKFLVVIEIFVFLALSLPNAFPPFIFFSVITIITSSLSLYFRTSVTQKGTFDFFAGCGAAQRELEYTPREILFGRVAARALVRGESPAIITIRSIILFCLCLIIPGFAIYVAIVVPILGETMTRNIYVSQSWNGGDGQFYWDPNSENITIALFYDAQRTSNVSVANFTIGTLGSVCNTSSIDIPRMMVNASCPFPWSAVPSDGLLITANFTDAGGVLYVKPGQGAASDVDTYTESIPLISGSHLSAVLGVTQRQIFSKKKLDYLGFTSLRKITVRSVLLVQADPSLHEPQLDTLSLRLLPRGDLPGFTKIVQDYTDASVLAGFANLGGFWTFVNGTFALVFGANLAYFLLGIRPLSPLGFVHFFQRRAALMDKWHQDFPKLRTEGGGRGSPLAGVVAFLRERLVHADEDVEAAFVTRYVDAQGKYYGFSAS